MSPRVYITLRGNEETFNCSFNSQFYGVKEIISSSILQPRDVFNWNYKCGSACSLGPLVAFNVI